MLREFSCDTKPNVVFNKVAAATLFPESKKFSAEKFYTSLRNFYNVHQAPFQKKGVSAFISNSLYATVFPDSLFKKVFHLLERLKEYEQQSNKDAGSLIHQISEQTNDIYKAAVAGCNQRVKVNHQLFMDLCSILEHGALYNPELDKRFTVFERSDDVELKDVFKQRNN